MHTYDRAVRIRAKPKDEGAGQVCTGNAALARQKQRDQSSECRAWVGASNDVYLLDRSMQVRDACLEGYKGEGGGCNAQADGAARDGDDPEMQDDVSVAPGWTGHSW